MLTEKRPVEAVPENVTAEPATLDDVLVEIQAVHKVLRGINRVVNVVGVLILLGMIVSACDALMSI